MAVVALFISGMIFGGAIVIAALHYAVSRGVGKGLNL